MNNPYIPPLWRGKNLDAGAERLVNDLLAELERIVDDVDDVCHDAKLSDESWNTLQALPLGDIAGKVVALADRVDAALGERKARNG